MISTALFYTEILPHGITNAECRVNADNVERSCAIHINEILYIFSYVFACSCVFVQSTLYALHWIGNLLPGPVLGVFWPTSPAVPALGVDKAQ